jgi:hypothetical protein
MKRGKPWSRGEKIAFGSLLVAVIGIPLLFPKVRYWLGEKPAVVPVTVSTVEPSKSIAPSSQSVAEPTPAVTPKVWLRSGTKAKGDKNVAGNNVAGNGNVVGNNNQVAAAPTIQAVAPNGIANAAPNFGNQTVNNMGPPEPRISYSIVDGPTLENVKNPHLCVKIAIDRMMENPKFAVRCDRACRPVFGDIILPASGGGTQDGGSGNFIPEHPEFAIFMISYPNPMPSNYGYLGCVESGDENPVRILSVGKFTIKP